jgi:hypothetical protein
VPARLFALSVAVAIPALVGWASPDALATSPRPLREPAADTILRPDLDRPPRSVRAGLSPGPGDAAALLGLARVRVGPAASATGRLSVRLAEGRGGRPDSLVAEPLADAVLRWRVGALARSARGETPFLPTRPVRGPPLPGQEAGRFVTEYADLALNVRSRMEFGGNWTRFRPCDNQFNVSCNPGLVPQLSPEVFFGVQIDGSIADRVRVDVDFDQAREFDAANRINIFYEGHEDDLLQRLEVGDVTFGLPPSRFLTQGIPAGNFGFQAEGQIGALGFQTVWAQQRGDLNSRVFQLTGLGDQRGFVQEDTLVLDDADYVRGQFFFLIDPTQINRYPHIDALELDPSSAPPTVSPGDTPIQLYRLEDDPSFQQQVAGFIQADAEASAGGVQVIESGWFRYLQEGLDYVVHPSGLWVALRAPLSRQEMLAVTYITAAGDTVGDYNPERIHNAGGRPRLRLLKASAANHQPGRPTWDLEMHQVYRVSGSRDVEPGSVALTISLGEPSAGRTFKRGPSGADITFLRLFGLDEEAPVDALDPSYLYSPGLELFGDESAVQGTFVVFPTLRPFAEPPPVPSLGLTESETLQILGPDANTRVYYEIDPVERDHAGRFRLSLAYRLRSRDVISSFSLGAFGVRDGSERIFLGERLLTRGADYEIDYDVGQVRLLEPDLLFAARPGAAVRATWEQRSLFQVSPTQVFGVRTHFDLGEGGGIDVLGLYQSERSVVSRPILGTEPGAALLGGLSGSYRASVGWLNGVLDRVPGLGVDGESALSLSGELAASVPNPNTRELAFLDDFDSSAQLPVSLLAQNWLLGSAPTLRGGAESVLPPSLDAATARSLVWQHTWVIESSQGDSVGVHEGFFPRTDVDRQIRIAGSESREPGLRLTLGSSRGGSPPGWRSLTTNLATNGLDLTRTEFLEFYASGGQAHTLVVDLGTVSEDAFFIDSLGNVAGTRPDGRMWGVGILDHEADPRRGEIWSDATDAFGVWGEACLAQRGRIYRLGDPNANCTRGNGRPDSEDLDADGNLDTAERHLRYVLPLDGSSPYRERSNTETGTSFQLYRIPIRDLSATSVGGAVTEADLRAVRHLRITVVGPAGVVQVARMRLVGSRWLKRAGEGVLAGVAGDTLLAIGRVEVSAVSRITEGAGYASPPGVLEQLEDPTAVFAGQGIEFSERSLGITFADVPPAARAEVYHRFPQSPRNFLSYGEMRVWVVARRGDFGPGRSNQFFLKVGSDSENFYLYRTHLPSPAGPSGITSADWLPEVRIHFERWYRLRLDAETRLSSAPSLPGDPPVVVWSSDSTYAVVLKDRGRAPNLAAVREISMGVWNGGPLPAAGEVWVNELRLGAAVRDAGLAGSFDIDLEAGGVLTSRLSMTSRGAYFRQLRDDATYQTDRAITSVSTLALDRWMPAAWGVVMPLSLEVGRSSQSPRFLQASDVRADRLTTLRPTEERRTRVSAGLRRRTRSANPVVGFLVDGIDANVGYTASDGSSVTTEHEGRSFDAGVAWVRQPTARAVDLVPDFADGVVRAVLPGFLEDAVADARLRLTPERVSVGGSYLRQDNIVHRYERILRLSSDSLTIGSKVPREAIQTVADVRLRPFRPLTADVTMLTSRDLLDPEEAVADPRVRELIRAERASPTGLDLGWETGRSLRTSIAYRPEIFSWLRNDVDWTTAYASERNANMLARSVVGADTTLMLARTVRAERDWGATVALDPGRLARVWLGDRSAGEDTGRARARAVMSSIRPLSVTYRDGVTSRFDRDPVDPGWGYQLGWADADGFRVLGADTAATLTDRYSWRLASGVSLPGEGGVQVAYQWANGRTLDTRSNRRTLVRSWPEIQASLPTLVPPAALGIRAVNVSSGVTRTRRRIEFGAAAAQRRIDEDLRIPLDVSVRWIRTLATTYQAAYRTGWSEDPTGTTERDEWTHRVSLTSQLLPSGFLTRRLEQPVNLALLGAYGSERTCRSTSARPECIAFVHQVRRTLNVSVDTRLRDFSVGLQASFDDRRSFVGQRSGSTQFQVGLFGQLDFSGGALPFG